MDRERKTERERGDKSNDDVESLCSRPECSCRCHHLPRVFFSAARRLLLHPFRSRSSLNSFMWL